MTHYRFSSYAYLAENEAALPRCACVVVGVSLWFVYIAGETLHSIWGEPHKTDYTGSIEQIVFAALFAIRIVIVVCIVSIYAVVKHVHIRDVLNFNFSTCKLQGKSSNSIN